MNDTERAFAIMADALGLVLGVEPGRMRSDTPLNDIGADPVAVVAAVDLVLTRFGSGGGGIDETGISTARTVGELALSVFR